MKCKYCSVVNPFAIVHCDDNESLINRKFQIGDSYIDTSIGLSTRRNGFYIEMERFTCIQGIDIIHQLEAKINYCPMCGKDLNKYLEEMSHSEIG